jgi:hypothetical protein
MLAYHGSKIDKTARKLHADKFGGKHGIRGNTNEFLSILIAMTALNNHSSTIDSRVAKPIAAVQGMIRNKHLLLKKRFSKIPSITIQKFRPPCNGFRKLK